MADYLDPVLAQFIADADRYLGPVKDMAAAATLAMEANDLLTQSVADLNGAFAGTAGAAGAAMGAIGQVGSAASDARDSIAAASSATGGFSRSLGGLAAKIDTVVMGSLAALDGELKKKVADLTAAAGAAGLLSGALRTNAASTVVAGAAAARYGRFWFLNGQILHWIIMGTLEILATAIPALVAFGAALAGMAPTFGNINDQMKSLIMSSGGMRGALLNSVGPLHQLGVNFGQLTTSMQPNALIIFGAAINSLAGHFGAFSKVAQQAGNVLAAFATKLSAELGGSLGGQITSFFSDSVHLMTQWGQLLGNLGHAFVNMATSMFGSAKILLDVLVSLSHILLVITSNPVASWFIGLAFAMSAAYRYGRLLMFIWTWMGGNALVTALRGLIAGFGGVGLAEEATVANTMALSAAFDSVIAAASAVAAVLAIAAAAYAIYYMWTNAVSKSAKALIAQVQAMPPTVENLTSGIVKLSAALQRQEAQVHQSSHGWGLLTSALLGAYHSFSEAKTADALTQAIARQKQELFNLITAMTQTALRTGSVGAGMATAALQVKLADSQVQQLNQSLDQYIQLVTGGTGGAAAFEQSLANIGSVAGTTAHNLGTATSMTLLSAKQFSAALSSFAGKGAGAWTNFNQVIGSMQSLMDWFRQASVLSATTGPAVQKAALDMAAGMVRYAGSNKTAQASILAFMRAQGLNFASWPKLLDAIKRQGAGQQDLARKVDATTLALSRLNTMARDAANILSSKVTTAIVNGAAASTGFNAALAKLQTDMANHQPASVIMADTANVNRLLQETATQAAQTAQSVQSASNTQVTAYAKALHEAQTYQSFVDSMHGANLYVNTYYQSHGYNPLGGIYKPPVAGADHGHGVPSHPVTVHVHGSVLSGQEIGRAVQGALNRKTVRNGSTQLFLQGRLH